MDKLPFPSYKVKILIEYPKSDRVDFILHNGFKIVVSRKQFQDFEAFKASVELHNKKRRNEFIK